MALTANQAREIFLEYFRTRGHQVVPSSSLVPVGDPTLLFTNAGMVQFKRVFLGEETRPYKRATSCQKCFRASGKHNDLENVGFTPRHHTFFEMLGNFSFGDYFKREAIAFAWELLTEGYKLPAEKLWVSVYTDDEEAARIWQEEIGLPTGRIVALGEKDNFWAMGETGPCGPCSEIHIDQGPQMGCGREDCGVGCDCDRFLELWNLVFMQFNRDSSGKMQPLPAPSIDTGMGLERITAVVQGVTSNYDTDLFQPIIARACDMAGVSYGQQEKTDISLRVVADHARACTFLVADGVLPSNEGRGYVLRRILRRAARHGRRLGFSGPFLYRLTEVVIEQMAGAYPELEGARELVTKVVKGEEERFDQTLDSGLKLLAEEIAKLKEAEATTLPGEVAFRLYDTYGFPLDLTMTIAAEEGMEVDTQGFDEAMATQRTRSRAAWKGAGGHQLPEALKALLAQDYSTRFTGYERLQDQGRVVALLDASGSEVQALEAGAEGQMVADLTPFYGMSGGQVGDKGWVEWEGGRAEVVDTLKPDPRIIIHCLRVTSGRLTKGQQVKLKVDAPRRMATAANHTATHLLHAALREVLGSHVKQAGSLVAPDRLRFDFTHFEALTPEQLNEVERIVNRHARADLPVVITETTMEEAVARGAIALFEERYGEKVRVVEVPGVSMELCGGTHLKRTGQIGLFKLVASSSVAAGVRRVEALTGEEALKMVQDGLRHLERACQALKARPEELADKAKELVSTARQLERQLSQLKARLAAAGGGADPLAGMQELDGIKLLVRKIPADDPKALREASDQLMSRMGSGVIVLGAEAGDKGLLLVRVSKDLAGRLHAGNIVKALAKIIGGGGGGRPEMAQAGGPNPAELDKALAQAPELVRQQLGS